MTTSGRVIACVAVAVVMALVVPAFSSAASAEPPTVRREAWSWVLQRDATPPLGDATGVRDGQLPVAWTGREDKVTFLEVAPVPNPEGTLTLTLAVDTAGNNHAIDDAEIQACAVTEPWEDVSPMAWDRQPARNCESVSEGIYQAATDDFFFDLSPLLPVLADTGWHGVVLAPDPAAASPAFQVVFQSATGGGGSIDHHPPSEADGDGDDSLAPPLTESPAHGGQPTFDPVPVPHTQSATPVSAPSAQGSPPEASAAEDTAAPPPQASEDTAAPPELAASQPVRRDRRASLAGFYFGIGALAVLLAARPAIPALSGLLGTGPGHEGPAARRRRSSGRPQ